MTTELLVSPWNARQTYFSSEVPMLLPLVGHAKVDRDGLQFITDEGQVPIYLNNFTSRPHRGVLVLATTGLVNLWSLRAWPPGAWRSACL